MTTRVLISFFCDDRPGVIEEISAVVNNSGGNWLDSQLSRLGGRFAGVLQVLVPIAKQQALADAIAALEKSGITATITAAGDAGPAPRATRRLTLLGPDRHGIIHELTRGLNAAGFNVQSLETGVEAAPMSGEALFRAEAVIELIEGSRLQELESAIERMADEMTLDIDLVEDA